MNKKVAIIAALGCIYAGAATSVNYDLLGRRGSKMNSPMVYKNIDYSKAKKDKGLGSSLENRRLMRLATGLKGNVNALVGAFCNKGLDYSTNYPVPYFMKRYYTDGNVDSSYYQTIAGMHGYLGPSSNYFMDVPTWQNYSYNEEHAGKTNVGNYTAENYYSFSNPLETTLYGYYQQIQYKKLFDVEYPMSKRASILWYDMGNNVCQECGKVGVYMAVDALPVELNENLDTNRAVKYIRHNPWDSYNATPETEIISSRTYNILKKTARNAVFYVGSSLPQNPANPSAQYAFWEVRPQIYVGVHNRKDPANVNNEQALFYSNEAQALDNHIYEKRTIEIAAAGNHWSRFNNGHLAAEAHAANAITVGAVDPFSGTITSYTSSETRYCSSGIGNCNGGSYSPASKKPEIYNYTHFFMNDETTYLEMNDQKRTYYQNGIPYVYYPFYDGTESAAAYTGGMVANLLAANPFYRWHPEVVKALLIASGDVAINSPYPHGSPATTKIPSYYSLVFDRDYSSYYHYSRYWIGDMNRLKTHNYSSKKEIRFVVKRPEGKTHFSAAIAWLTSGNDIANLGKIAQDFDLYVYERNVDNINDISGSYKASSLSSNNAFEKISFTSSSPYLLFRIRLFGEADNTENKDQAVLGFDLAASN